MYKILFVCLFGIVVILHRILCENSVGNVPQVNLQRHGGRGRRHGNVATCPILMAAGHGHNSQISPMSGGPLSH